MAWRHSQVVSLPQQAPHDIIAPRFTPCSNSSLASLAFVIPPERVYSASAMLSWGWGRGALSRFTRAAPHCAGCEGIRDIGGAAP